MFEGSTIFSPLVVHSLIVSTHVKNRLTLLQPSKTSEVIPFRSTG